MENPEWYGQGSTHKDVNYGNGLRIPLCKVVHRDQWPREGVWSINDIVSRVWRIVTCEECNRLKEEWK